MIHLSFDAATKLSESLEISIGKAVREFATANGIADTGALDLEVGFVLARLAVRYGFDLMPANVDAIITRAERVIDPPPALVTLDLGRTDKVIGTVYAVCPGRPHGEYDPYCEVCDYRPPAPRIAAGSTPGKSWIVEVDGSGDTSLHENIRLIVRAEMAAASGTSNRARIEAGSFASRFGYEVATFHIDDLVRTVRVRLAHA